MMFKRRLGREQPQSKLTENDVREIRSLHGTMTQRAIAAKYGIDPAIVSLIIRRRRWAHVE